MTTRYQDAYNAIARQQARVAEHALCMVIDDEARHRRDSVLLALETMRQRLAERGVAVAPQEVLTVLEETTGQTTRGMRLPTMLADARKRQAARETIDPKMLLQEAAQSVIDSAPARKNRTAPDEKD